MTLMTNRILAYGSWGFVMAGAYMLGDIAGVFISVGVPGLIIAMANEVIPALTAGKGDE